MSSSLGTSISNLAGHGLRMGNTDEPTRQLPGLGCFIRSGVRLGLGESRAISPAGLAETSRLGEWQRDWSPLVLLILYLSSCFTRIAGVDALMFLCPRRTEDFPGDTERFPERCNDEVIMSNFRSSYIWCLLIRLKVGGCCAQAGCWYKYQDVPRVSGDSFMDGRAFYSALEY